MNKQTKILKLPITSGRIVEVINHFTKSSSNLQSVFHYSIKNKDLSLQKATALLNILKYQSIRQIRQGLYEIINFKKAVPVTRHLKKISHQSSMIYNVKGKNYRGIHGGPGVYPIKVAKTLLDCLDYLMVEINKKFPKLIESTVYLGEAYAEKGRTIKSRFMRAMGRSSPKALERITINLDLVVQEHLLS